MIHWILERLKHKEAAGQSCGGFSMDGDSNRRARDICALGFMGESSQPLYYAGAVMAQKIEAAYGREALVCIMTLAPEQFVLAYDAAADEDGVEAAPVGRGAVRAALAPGTGMRSYCTSAFDWYAQVDDVTVSGNFEAPSVLEPATLALVGVGLLGAGAMRRRRTV